MVLTTFRISTLKFTLLLLIIFGWMSAYSQNSKSKVEGIVKDEWDNRLEGVSISVLGRHEGTISGPKGEFSIDVPAGRAFALIFTHASYSPVQRNFLLNEQEVEYVEIVLAKGETPLDSVVVTANTGRNE